VVETLYAVVLGAVMCAISVVSGLTVVRLFKGQDS
jgi:hypothetical protein